MKRFLILALVLVCAPLWAALDLTKPADNGYVASFPAEVRANQTAIVASLTPPIEWTGEGSSTYGTASVKLGFAGASDYPMYWLGSIGVGTAYVFGPRAAVPTDISGWYVTIASAGGLCFARIGMPALDGSTDAAGVIDVASTHIDLNGRQIRDLNNPTAASHAVSLGYMQAYLDPVLVVANMSDGTGTGYASWGGSLGALATFTFEMVDTHSSWDGATFTAPIDGIYEVKCGLVFAPVAAYTDETSAMLQFFADSNRAASPASAPILFGIQTVATEAFSFTNLSAFSCLPMSAGETFVINLSTNAGAEITVRLQDARLLIRKIADLP
jgi:hypothetical protein